MITGTSTFASALGWLSLAYNFNLHTFKMESQSQWHPLRGASGNRLQTWDLLG